MLDSRGPVRLRAGRREVAVEAGTLGAAMRALGEACPDLCGVVVDGERLGPGYIVAVNGGPLTADPTTVLAAGDVLVLISAQAGG